LFSALKFPHLELKQSEREQLIDVNVGMSLRVIGASLARHYFNWERSLLLVGSRIRQ
jgi:hypothetical protein